MAAFICISAATLMRNRILPSHCRQVWWSQRTFYGSWVAYAIDRSRRARPPQYHQTHHRRNASDTSHRDVSRRGSNRTRPQRRRATACRKCRGTWHHIGCRTTSSSCLTSGGPTWGAAARGSWSRVRPTSACVTGTCLGSANCTALCSRSTSRCYDRHPAINSFSFNFYL